jgi:hypothetical protein
MAARLYSYFRDEGAPRAVTPRIEQDGLAGEVMPASWSWSSLTAYAVTIRSDQRRDRSRVRLGRQEHA